MKLIFFIFIFIFFNTYSFSKENVLILKNGIGEYQIGPFVEVLEDKTNKLTIKDIENGQYKKEFKRNKLDTIELKTGTSTYWLKIKTENKRLKESYKNGEPLTWYFYFNHYVFDKVTFFKKNSKGNEWLKNYSGFDIPVKKREVQSLLPTFIVNLKESQTFYFKLQNDLFKTYETMIPLKIHLSSPINYYYFKRFLYIVSFLFCGFLLTLFIYNLLNLIETKSITDSYYTGSLLFWFLWCFHFYGHSHLYLYPNYRFLFWDFSWYLAAGFNLFFSPFLYSYLSFKNNKERYAEVIKFKWFFVYFGSYTFLQIILSKVNYLVGFYFGLSNTILCWGALLLILIYFKKKQVKPAQILLQAMLIFYLPLVIWMLTFLNVIPSNTFTDNIWMLGNVGLQLALSKILINRHKNLQVELVKKEFEAKQFEREAEKKLKDEVRKVRLIMSEQTRTLKTQNNLLTEADSKKTEFFKNISHELRTPLTLILNPLGKLLDQDSRNEELIIVNRNAQRLYKLVNQLRDFQKVSSGEVEVSIKKVNLLNFLEKCVESFKNNLEHKKIQFSFLFNKKEVTPSLLRNKKIFIKGDLESIEKIVQNFLSNAFYHTQEGSSITLSCDIGGEIPEGKVRISVIDEGTGIAKEQQAFLSETFSHNSTGIGLAGGGKGLGLPLVKELTERLKGEMNFTSEEGKGSHFYVELPIYHYNLIDCLIVDDEEDIRVIYSDLCEQTDFIETFKIAKSADQAREFMEAFSFQVILSDAAMPGESGIDFLKWASQASPDSKRYLVTGKADEKILQDSVNEGKVDGVIFKPWSKKELLSKVKSSLEEEESANIEDYLMTNWSFSQDNENDDDDLEEDHFDGDLMEGYTEVVLIVDDLGDMRKMMANALKSSNFQTIGAKNGKDGLEKALKYKPDLIVTDWVMPIMSGPDLIRKLREHKEFKSTPIVLLTAKSDEESKILGSEIGADGFLGKPFNEHELVSVVGNLLSLKSKEKEVINLNKHITENVLKRYLPPALVDDIVAGKVSLNQEPKAITGTILFADLCQFTKTTQRLRSVKMSRVLNEYLSFMNEIIYKHHGTIDKFIGDAIMVIFGAPVEIVPQEQAKRAIACAMEMQNRMCELNDKWETEKIPNISMRIGIHFGPLIVGNFGGEKRSDYTAIGSTVNLASRIETACEPGEIYMSGEICDFLGENEFEEAGSFSLKGLDGNTYLYRLKKTA